MKNLIMADLKVLGHRIWAVPLSVFLFIFSFSFVPYLDQVYKFQNWIFAILIPGLLTYELFREEQKNGTGSFLMTMPVSKEAYVWGKCFSVTLFSFFAVAVGFLSNYILSYLKNTDIPSIGLMSYGFDYINSASWALKFILFAIPIYFLTNKLKSSVVIALAVLYFFLEGYFSLYYRIFYVSIFVDHAFPDFIFNIVLAVLIIFLTVIIAKILFRKTKKDFIYTGLYGGLFYLTVVVFQLLLEHLNIFHLYFWYNSYLSRTDLTIKQIDHVKDMINSYKQLTLTLFILFILLFTVLVFIRKRTENKFWQNCVIYIFTPVFIMIFEQEFFNTLREIFPQSVTHEPDITSYPLFKIPLLYGLAIALFISARSSVYLLKNNRTLK
jgi:hypothetical protein